MMNLYSAKIWNKALAIAQNCYICNLGIQTRFKLCEFACQDFDLTGKGKRGFYMLVFDMLRTMDKYQTSLCLDKKEEV